MKKKNIAAGALMLIMLLSGCGFTSPFSKGDTIKWNSEAFLRVGDTQIDYHEALVYLDAAKSDYEKYYGDAIWDYRVDAGGDTVWDKVRADVLEDIIYMKVVCSKATELGVTLTNDELLQVDRDAASYMEKIGTEAAEERGITEETVHRVYEDNALAQKIFEKATLNIDTNISTEDAKRGHYYAIALRKYKIGSDGTKTEYSDDEKSDILDKMEELLQEATEAKNFLKYAESVTEESGYLDFYAGADNIPAGAEEALLLLDGEISSVIETEDYYFIFYCVSQLDLDATLARKEEIIVERQKEAFEELSAKWRSEADVEVNEDVWNSLSLR